MDSSPSLSEALVRVLDERLHDDVLRPNEKSLTALCRGVADLSRLFTKARRHLPHDYLRTDALRVAYLAYFLPVNAAKVQILLNELDSTGSLLPVPASTILSVLDVGCGPGTASLAVLDWMKRPGRNAHIEIRTTAIDQAGAALRDAERLWDAYCRSQSITSAHLTHLVTDLERTKSWRDIGGGGIGMFDLIVVANTLNELWTTSPDRCKRRSNAVQHLLKALHPHGSLIIVEPALRETARDLHYVRDFLLKQSLCTVYSPCLHERSCPALANDEDWCHEERSWIPPTLVADIDRRVGFIKDALKFSYLILRKDGRTVTPRGDMTFRVVSELRELKGDTRAWLCNETGRVQVGRLDRDRTPRNAALDDWHRGAIVRVDDIQWKREGERLGRIDDRSHAELIRPV